jgi:hypothetical protein
MLDPQPHVFGEARRNLPMENGLKARTPGSERSPAAQLQSLMDRFEPDTRRVIRSFRTALRRRLPSAHELVYEYTHSLVIAYSATQHPRDSIISFAARLDGMRLYFARYNKLPDPKKLLKGSGSQVRFIHLDAASQLAHPDVEALIAAAIRHAKVPLPTGRGKLIIRSLREGRPSRATS